MHPAQLLFDIKVLISISNSKLDDNFNKFKKLDPSPEASTATFNLGLNL